VSCCVFGQKSDKPTNTDVIDTSKVKKHNPKKATIMSAIIPGLGQIYNRKYWKPPIIYAGFATAIFMIDFNTYYYKKYKLFYNNKVDNNPATPDFYPYNSLDELLSLKNYYRRNLELSYIATSLVYLLNVIDANVDGNLYDFDVSDDLSLNIKPSVIKPDCAQGMATGLTITLSFNNALKKHRD